MEAGLWVTVVDANTGLGAACGALAWIVEGSYIDTLRVTGCDWPDSLRPWTFDGAIERPGTYEIFILKQGYHMWHISNVVVVRKKCACHVTTTKVEARLEPR